MKLEADALRDAGYTELGWREVSTADLGVPNPKTHILLMASAMFGPVVDSCLFSSVRQFPSLVCLVNIPLVHSNCDRITCDVLPLYQLTQSSLCLHWHL